MKKFFNWIICNFQEEIHNLPLFIPVFIGLGIVFYFSLENEPATWLIYLLFGITSFFFFFINLGNSSDRIKHYKLVVAFSAFKYIFKKLLKIFLFALLLPIIGHITLFVLIGSWVVSLFEYSYYLRYFALLYDNALMREIIKGVSFILSPITKEIRKTKFYKYLKNIAKTEIKKTKKKKTKQKKIWKLFISSCH